jgi:hypothetical protein
VDVAHNVQETALEPTNIPGIKIHEILLKIPMAMLGHAIPVALDAPELADMHVQVAVAAVVVVDVKVAPVVVIVRVYLAVLEQKCI